MHDWSNLRRYIQFVDRLQSRGEATAISLETRAAVYRALSFLEDRDVIQPVGTDICGRCQGSGTEEMGVECIGCHGDCRISVYEMETTGLQRGEEHA